MEQLRELFEAWLNSTERCGGIFALLIGGLGFVLGAIFAHFLLPMVRETLISRIRVKNYIKQLKIQMNMVGAVSDDHCSYHTTSSLRSSRDYPVINTGVLRLAPENMSTNDKRMEIILSLIPTIETLNQQMSAWNKIRKTYKGAYAELIAMDGYDKDVKAVWEQITVALLKL